MKQLLVLLIAASSALGVQRGRAVMMPAPPPLNIPSDRTFQTGHTARVSALAFMPDGRLLSVGGDKTFRIWDSKTGIQQTTFSTDFTGDGYIAAVAFDRTGKDLVVVTNDAVQRWEFETRRRIWSAAADLGDVRSAAFSRDGRSISVSSIEGDFELHRITKQFDAATGRFLRTRTTTAPDSAGNPDIMATSAAGALNATAMGDDIFLKDARGRTLHVLTRQLGIGAFAFSSDGKLLASGSNGAGDGALKLWDVASGRESKIFDGEREWVLSLAFSPDEKFLVAGGQGVRIFDVQRGVRIRELGAASDSVSCVIFTPDGAKLASTGASLNVWDFVTGAPLFSIPRRFAVAAFSPDGQLIAAAGMGSSLTIYSVATGQVVRTLPLPDGYPSTLEFSPDGSRLALGTRSITLSNNAVIAMLDLNTGRPFFTIPAANWVSKVAFIDSMRFMAVFGRMDQPGAVTLYDAQSGSELRTLRARVDASKAAAFTPDRMWIAGGPFDLSGAIELWRLML
jgi:WD40 repeat protein